MKNHKIFWLVLPTILALVILAGCTNPQAEEARQREIDQLVENKVMEMEGPLGTGTTSTTPATTGTLDQQLVGTWESACLVPDPDSPWAEKHQFVFNADGTAVHTRWSNESGCTPATMTLTDVYRYQTPAAGQINLIDTEKGATIYDIYQVSGNILYLGHGFRNDLPYSGSDGGSPAGRISTLNTYIKYQKVK